VPIFYFLMTLKINIFPFFVLFSCKNVKQKDPDQFFQEMMSHLKAQNLKAQNVGTTFIRGP
jgi:hypothetical protein